MQFNFYVISVTVPVPKDDDRPDIMWSDILRLGDCSEIDVAGNLFKEESTGKYYCCDFMEDTTGNTTAKYYCCDVETENAPECADPECTDSECDGWVYWLILGIHFVPFVLFGIYLFGLCLSSIIRCFCDCVKTCYIKMQRAQVGNEVRLRYGSERSNISTISVDSIFHEVIQEDPVDRLPRSKASVDQCTKRSKYISIEIYNQIT